MGASFSKSSSKQGQSSRSGTQFPTDFLSQFGNAFGSGVSMQELLGALPSTQGLFGGGRVGIFGTGAGGAPGAGAAPAAGGNPAAFPGTGGAPGTAPTAGGAQGQGGPAAPDRRYTLGELTPHFANANPNNPAFAQRLTQLLNTQAGRMGIDPTQGVTAAQLREMGLAAGNPYGNFFSTQLQGLLQNQDSLTPGAPRFAASGTQGGGINWQQGMQDLGFFTPTAAATPYQFRDMGTITPAQAQAAQSEIAPRGFGELERSMFESGYRPVEREINRLGALQDRQTQAELAQAGLASSGAGQGQLAEQRRDRAGQLQAAAEDAASRATTARFGAEFQQAQQNADRRQQVSLANAGFNQQAQEQNAANILAGDAARSQHYLAALGLDRETANQQRTSFLAAMGLQQQDLQRMDQFQLQTLGVLLNNWLQQYGVVAGSGQVSQSRGTGESSSFGQSAGISG